MVQARGMHARMMVGTAAMHGDSSHKQPGSAGCGGRQHAVATLRIGSGSGSMVLPQLVDNKPGPDPAALRQAIDPSLLCTGLVWSGT